MELTDDGFLRPKQLGSLSQSEDARIARLCPGLGQEVEAQGRSDDPLWGPYLEVKSGWAADPDLRYQGSSGGVLSALIAWMIESGKIAGALETGADAERPVANTQLVAASRNDVLSAAGSRYAPSSPLAALDKVPDDGRPRAFVGKPCDAAAFRVMSEDDASLAARFPVVFSFFCAGIPSLQGAEAILAALGTSPRETVGFRYRGNGWPGRATATLRDGTSRSMSYQESWGEILSSRVQHRCKVCADGTGKAADLVCADAWETDDAGYPVFQEREGISLIVARTLKGAILLKAAEDAGAIVTGPFDFSRLAAMQPGQRRRRQALLARLLALRILGRPVPRYRGLGVFAAARTGRPGWWARNFIGTLRREITRRR